MDVSSGCANVFIVVEKYYEMVITYDSGKRYTARIAAVNIGGKACE